LSEQSHIYKKTTRTRVIQEQAIRIGEQQEQDKPTRRKVVLVKGKIVVGREYGLIARRSIIITATRVSTQ